MPIIAMNMSEPDVNGRVAACLAEALSPRSSIG